MNALDVAKQILKQSKTALSPNKMYKIAQNLGLDKHLNFSGKTPWASFAAVIYVDLKKPNSHFEYANKKPILIKLKGQEMAENLDEKEHFAKRTNFTERDLHPLLANFVYSNEVFQLFCKTIHHENSKKNQKGANKWLYPDIVGVSFEYSKFRNDTLKLINKFDKLPLKIYSFEMKIELNVANFREYFFQAVSNSSWANEGYLVALDIDDSDSALMELIQKTSNAFGIGVISLDSKNIAQSKVISPAKFKENIDFAVIDELANKNSDFANFIQLIVEFDHERESRYLDEFDEIIEGERFQKYLKSKGIC